ncbi:protein NRT1/ PTR FAMILY 5.5-like [Bidens hawaiensis]|uniref:protein NRT1/ PTR FAMILY 5.5-like n=1 Tax=Bidens hawaiensis TaxID=980011 RepID=UPI004049BE68
MVNYLTNVWNLSITHAAGIINIFNGITPALAIALLFFADTFLGDFYTLALSSIGYSIGLGLLSLSTPTIFGPCHHYKEECVGHAQKDLFYIAVSLIAVGQAGQQASLESFIDIQNEARVEARAKAEAVAKAEAKDRAYAEAQAKARVRAYAEALAEAEMRAFAEALAEAEARGEVVAEAEVRAGAGAGAQAEAEARAQAQAEAEAQVYGEALAEAYTEALAKAEHEEEPKSPRGPASKAINEDGVKALYQIGKAIISLMLILLIVVLVIVCGGIAFPYIKPWSIRFGIPAICASIATVLFITGSSQYKHGKPKGSPLTIPIRVFVAAVSKDFQQVKNFTQIYIDEDIRSTNSLSWLDKAAIKYPDQARSKSWTLCSLREVEETKTRIHMAPLLLTFVGTAITLSLGNTYFLEQANHMDRKLGSIKIQIPIFLLFYTCSASISHGIFVLVLECTPISKRYYALVRISVGMGLSILCCITAAIVETQRLDVIRNHGLVDKSDERIPTSVFSLLPQFLLLGAVDGFTNSSIERFLQRQLPTSRYKYLMLLQRFVIGLGSVASVLSVYVVGKVSETNNDPNWFQHTSNKSRLDRYYWTLAGLNAVDLVIFAIVAYSFKYKDI